MHVDKSKKIRVKLKTISLKKTFKAIQGTSSIHNLQMRDNYETN